MDEVRRLRAELQRAKAANTLDLTLVSDDDDDDAGEGAAGGGAAAGPCASRHPTRQAAKRAREAASRSCAAASVRVKRQRYPAGFKSWQWFKGVVEGRRFADLEQCIDDLNDSDMWVLLGGHGPRKETPLCHTVAHAPPDGTGLAPRPERARSLCTPHPLHQPQPPLPSPSHALSVAPQRLPRLALGLSAQTLHGRQHEVLRY